MIDPYDAIVLAGGRGFRLGAGRKPEVRVRGRRLLDIALDAVVGARQRIVVGPLDLPVDVRVTREDPPFGGPVAGVAAGLAARTGRAPWTLLLASDLPWAEPAVDALLAADPEDHHDGVCLAEPDGRLQWLLGVYRTPVLERRWSERGNPPITALYRMLGPLDLMAVPGDPRHLVDVDTPADLVRAEQEA